MRVIDSLYFFELYKDVDPMSKKVQHPQRTSRHTIAQKHRHSKFLINHKVATKLPYGKGFNIKRKIIFLSRIAYCDIFSEGMIAANIYREKNIAKPRAAIPDFRNNDRIKTV